MDDVDIFLTMGDNLYPVNDTNPTDEEFQQMLGLFQQRDALKDLPIFGIRGNHDCVYRKELLLELALKTDNQWNMPYYYYKNEIVINEETGSKFGVLMIDSCLLLCSNYTYGPITMHVELQQLKDITCEDTWYRDEGNKMYDWINKTLTQWDQDESIIWKASV